MARGPPAGGAEGPGEARRRARALPAAGPVPVTRRVQLEVPLVDTDSTQDSLPEQAEFKLLDMKHGTPGPASGPRIDLSAPGPDLDVPVLEWAFLVLSTAPLV